MKPWPVAAAEVTQLKCPRGHRPESPSGRAGRALAQVMPGQGRDSSSSWKGFSGSRETPTPSWRQRYRQPCLLGGFPKQSCVCHRRSQPSPAEVTPSTSVGWHHILPALTHNRQHPLPGKMKESAALLQNKASRIR